MAKPKKTTDTVVERREYEFGGPWVFPSHDGLVGPTLLTFRDRLGAFGISAGLPVVCYAMTFLCNDISGCPAPALLHPSKLTLHELKKQTGWPEDGLLGLVNLEATAWLLGYYLLLFVLQIVLPGQKVEGVELRTGGRLKYKFNCELNTPRPLPGSSYFLQASSCSPSELQYFF